MLASWVDALQLRRFFELPETHCTAPSRVGSIKSATVCLKTDIIHKLLQLLFALKNLNYLQISFSKHFKN